MLGDTRERFKRTDSALITGTLIIAALYFARAVFIPLALAGLLAFLLAPAATWLERRRVQRTAAALLMIFVSLAAAVALGWVMLGQIYNLAIELPQYQENISQKLQSLHLNSAGKLTSTIDMLTKLGKQIEHGDSSTPPVPPAAGPPLNSSRKTSALAASTNQSAVPVAVRIEQPEESMTAEVGRTMIPFLGPVATAFIVVIFLVFMLLGREDLLDRGLRLAGIERIYVTTTAIEDASRRVSRYLLMQLVVNLSYGAIAGGGLWLIGIPDPLLWGVLTCILRFVPYAGILMAAAGPLLLSVSVSPHWSSLVWTISMYAILELVTGNFVEPTVYGASTGMSAIAIMIAAIFWTILWGFPGLLLSIPLTVCLVAIGRQVPRLGFLEVLFGEERALPLGDRFYQRMLAGNTHAARSLIEGMMKTESVEDIYDGILVPVLTQIEEARHSEQMTGRSAEEVLQGVEELVEELESNTRKGREADSKPMKRMACVPARDFADEVACQLALQVLTDTVTMQVMSADTSTSELLQSLETFQPNAVCVIGVPPHAIRHLRMRCQQIRTRMPDVLVVACLLTTESDLSNLRSRIATEDAHHVVHSIQLLKQYLISLLTSPAVQSEGAPASQQDVDAAMELTDTAREIRDADLFDQPEDGMFDRLASKLARSFDAPIALISSADGQRYFWEAQCGLANDSLSASESAWDLSKCSKIVFSDSTLVLPDTLDDECFADDQFLLEKGVRFYAGAPLTAQNGEVIGSLCVLDTRPRQMTEQQKEQLTSIAHLIMTAIELHRVEETDKLSVLHEEIQQVPPQFTIRSIQVKSSC